VVQRGDNLSKIAGKVYGDRKQWRKIYDANKDRIRKDYTIFANQTLVIPAQ
ncbi:MAG: LysM peptidoglycan-binding domain-containing protein, partial [Lachnospiraceae bacterium]|nr:LysM peptidoglycan-binding domain-containing protein [Lachnospiraceae bacterium]